MKPLRKIIHVNKQKIAQNRIHGTTMPVITCKTYKDNHYGHEVVFHGESRIIYRPHKPLSCGARLWVETFGKVEIIDNDKGITTEIA